MPVLYQHIELVYEIFSSGISGVRIDRVKNLIFLFLISLSVLAVYQKALFNFFAQDDFILINQFSQSNLILDLKNVFGLPTVTHWRPIHNLYFFLAGNLFAKNYVGYHVLTLIFHIGASFLIYKTAYLLLKNRTASVTAGIFYGIHPAHFISLFWISGGATVIGFFFLIASFYSYLINKRGLSLVLFLMSILASEAMLIEVVIILVWEILMKGQRLDKGFLAKIGLVSFVFALLRFAVLTPKVTFDIYKIEFSTKIIASLRYYFLRIAGFAEVASDQISTFILLAWLVLIGGLLINNLQKKKSYQLALFSILIIVLGLFPFVLIPTHLSPHYMNVSVFGLAMLVAITLRHRAPIVAVVVLVFFALITVSNINLIKNNNWVIKRSNLAKTYISQIEQKRLAVGSTIIFNDNQISTSSEAYISLGTGQAIRFWFADENYQTCFRAFEKCN